MMISAVEEQMVLSPNNVKDSLMSPSERSTFDSPDGGSSMMTESPDLPPAVVVSDVNVVPEQIKPELEQSIANLEGDIVQLRLKKRLFDEKRRDALNKILDIKGAIRVFCRVRSFPVTDRRKINVPILTELEKIAVRSAGVKKEFGFDKVFNQTASQEDIFVEVEPILRSALDGHNVCILAYGQTGTGKTFTMDGTSDQPGIVPRALEEIFRQSSLDKTYSISFSMSMLEVYMGHLRDLLAPRPICRAYEPISRCNLNIQTDAKGLVEIEGLTEVQISDVTKARWWYNKGRRVRSTSWTNVNEVSSRSHCLTRITIFRNGDELNTKREVSKLWMVDLGGSERLLKTGATGLTLDEGRAINLSLSALADVIAALRRKRGHVPYRNSKLTQILKDSLGDGSKVLMLAHVSPCDEDVGETICSLSFGKRARAVESIRELSEDMRKLREKKIAELEGDMREAEIESQKVGNQIREVVCLLSEKKKLFSTHRLHVDEEKTTLETPKENLKEAVRTPRASEKLIRKSNSNSVPRFMTSTVASRQRQGAAEREINLRLRSLRTGFRSSVQFSNSQSQSHSFSDPRLKLMLRSSSNKKPRYVEPNGLTESPKATVLDSKSNLSASKTLRNNIITASDSNLKVTLSRHRRRMSDFM